MGFMDLFIVALMPVLKVILITGLGLFLALDRINLLGLGARHHLNNLVFYVLGPAFVGSSLAETVTFQSFLNLWFMPVNIFITYIIGSALAWVLIRITKTPKHLQGMVIGCCSGGNMGNLLLILIPAICKESNNPFGDSSICSTNAEAYASLSMAIGAVFMWSYVYSIMRMYASEGTSNTVSETCKEALLPSTSCEYYSTQDGLPLTTYGAGKKIILHIKMIMGKIDLKKVFAPTATAAIVGFIVGIVPPFRRLMIGDSAPLRVIGTSAYLLGEAAIPCLTLILGANLLRGLNGSEVSHIVVIGIIVVRNIAMPLLGICVVNAAHHLGMVTTDSLYRFVLMLQYTVPPATAVGTISEFLQLGQGESSVIMLWTYAVASISLTLWSTIFMWLLA
ncbi:Auxin efflux carrier family protein isoform 1 [Hibiscus syriacus]|uniref:Auxin efflux carrier family protein isoform 1 n=1 Tax=Hibiscus syriacus TaxID=106335 RepID=A0A6A2XV03_HIBSY|nr:protein PIN-LIKES 1-like [Hibiscus syriacus]KAE8670655.1 Auxin efflux carrier family protein isoform 1 [Hibiscus syriacus]